MSDEPPRAVADAPARPSSEKPADRDTTPEQPNGTGMSCASGDADHALIGPLAANAAPVANTIVPPPRSSSRGPSTEQLRRTPSKSTDPAEPGSAPDTDAEPKKKRSFLNIPRSNSQSNEEQTPTGTGLSGATVADSESIGRGSKRSFLGKRRAGSTASSKRSNQPAASEKADQPPPVPSTDHRDAPTSSKARKSGGLLSCLPCFAPRDVRPAGEETPPENAKEAGKVKPGRTKQSTPVKKHDPTAESSTADSKEPLDEKAAGDAYGVDRLEKPHGDGTTERPSSDAPPKIVTRTSSKKQSAEQPLPPLPNQPGTLQTGHPQISIQTPTPGTTPVQPRPSHEQEQIIHDRTQEQEEIDQDIEMKDVPLASNEVRHEGDDSSSEAKNEIPPKVDLPPPPPLEQRQNAVRDQTSDSTMSEAQPKFLLGPIRPEFKGKKCLVLDLDETLVHSSFKVRHSLSFAI